MGYRQHIQKQSSQKSAFTPQTNVFEPRPFANGVRARSAQLPQTDLLQTRPFASPTQVKSENPDLQTQEEITEPVGYSLEKIRISAPSAPPPPPPVQRKGELGGWYLPHIQRATGGMNWLSLSREQKLGGEEEKQPIQAKLTVGEAGDKYEQEADAVARQVVDKINSPQPQHSVQRQSDTGVASELGLNVMCQSQGSVGLGSSVTQDVEQGIQQARGGGRSLDESVRQPMEQAFGVDFSRVRVHTDSQSDQLNRSIQAKAFTTGQDIFFRQGTYNPGSRGGQELLAHELTHVVQQGGASSIQCSVDSSVQRKCAACEAEKTEVANIAPSMHLSNKSTEQLLQRQATSPAGSGMHPPGDCTFAEHRQLQDEVNEWCKNKPRSCDESQTIEDLEERIENNSKCIASRNRINNKCFRGGDDGHKEALEIAINSLMRCQRVRERVKARQPQQQKSPDFMKKMSEITGLTGTALLIYLIISEGSRLFPPRNLVPVP